MLSSRAVTIAAAGGASNGGARGLGMLAFGSFLAWRAFSLIRRSPWLRRLLQLPLTAIVTFMAIHDAFAQCLSGKWLRI